MSIEVNWLPDKEGLGPHNEELNEGGVAWMSGYGDGDGSGKETCIVLNEGIDCSDSARPDNDH